jgi:hypothetical protein
MNQQVINVDGSGNDCSLVFWEPSEMQKAGLDNACDLVGLGACKPKHSTVAAALEESFGRLLDSAKVKVRGKPIRFFRLAGVVGFEARQIHPGQQDVDPVPVASIALDDDNLPRVIKHNSAILPQVDTHRVKIEEILAKNFENRMTVYPTTMVSTCLSKVISALGGILIKQTGGLFFVPGHSTDKFDAFAKAIDSCQCQKPQIVMVKFPLVPTESSYTSVLTAVQRVANERLKVVEESMSDLGGDKKMRSDGINTRLEECQSVLDLLESYENILGTSLADAKEMALKVRSAVNAHAALAWAS